MSSSSTGPGLLDRLRAAGRAVQRAVVWAGLLVLYLVGLGVVRAWMAVFHRSLLRDPPEPRWLPVSDPVLDPEASRRQS